MLEIKMNKAKVQRWSSLEATQHKGESVVYRDVIEIRPLHTSRHCMLVCHSSFVLLAMTMTTFIDSNVHFIMTAIYSGMFTPSSKSETILAQILTDCFDVLIGKLH